MVSIDIVINQASSQDFVFLMSFHIIIDRFWPSVTRMTLFNQYIKAWSYHWQVALRLSMTQVFNINIHCLCGLGIGHTWVASSINRFVYEHQTFGFGQNIIGTCLSFLFFANHLFNFPIFWNFFLYILLSNKKDCHCLVSLPPCSTAKMLPQCREGAHCLPLHYDLYIRQVHPLSM